MGFYVSCCWFSIWSHFENMNESCGEYFRQHLFNINILQIFYSYISPRFKNVIQVFWQIIINCPNVAYEVMDLQINKKKIKKQDKKFRIISTHFRVKGWSVLLM